MGDLLRYVIRAPVFSSVDPLGLACDATGCWTIPLERRFLNTGNYHEYYLVACAGDDKDACFDDSSSAWTSWRPPS